MIKDLLFPNLSKQFIKRLRKAEHHKNSSGLFHKFMFFFAYCRLESFSRKHSIRVPLNSCGKGLQIPHPECVAIGYGCVIGENFRIQKMTSVGPAFGTKKCPKIGNNVYVGPGAIIYGDIEIADNCWIGANAVVNKSFLEPYSVIAGVPAKVVKMETRNWMEVMGKDKKVKS